MALSNGSTKCEFISDGVCNLFGYTRKELLQGFATSHSFRVHPDDILRVHEAILNTVKEGKQFKEQYRIMKKDGSMRYYCSFTDITPVKDLDAQRQQLAKALGEAKKANEAKTQFLSNMSHDIRTPMNAIINMTSITRDDYLKISDGDVLDDLDKIETSGDFLMGLAIAKNIVELMNGGLNISSTKGCGTDVVIDLKLKLATKKQIEENENTKKEGNSKIDLTGKRVLIVEDNNLNMIILERILNNQQMIVMKASNGLEALEFIEATEENLQKHINKM